jgi:hypothetical protein
MLSIEETLVAMRRKMRPLLETTMEAKVHKLRAELQREVAAMQN